MMYRPQDEGRRVRIYKSRRYRWHERLWQIQQLTGMQALLWPFALCYRAAVWGRLFLYRCLLPRHKLPAPTISVGNIVSGGSGKTPIVLTIAQQLAAQDERVAVLSRGYGSNLRGREFTVLRGDRIVCGKKDVQALDEARLLAHALPQATVIAAPRRYAAAQAYLAVSEEAPPTCFVLDDGFQHVQIARDLDIVLLDAARPFADARPLPCGMLREPRGALRRADLVLFTRATADTPSAYQVRKVQQHTPHTVLVKFVSPTLAAMPPTRTSFGEQHNPVLLICGVAAPTQVLSAVQHLGIQVRLALYLADHETCPRHVVRRLTPYANAIVTTTKDYWRDEDFYAQQPVPVYTITLTTDFDFTPWQRVIRQGN